MVTHEENELLTRIDGNAPMGRLMRDHYWIPFALSSQLVAGAGPVPVRLFGENYVAFRAESGRIGFFDELCPHRRASLVLARAEGDCLRCIYHGWKLDVAGCVVEAPTQQVRPERFAASVPVVHFPVHESGGLAWVWLGGVHAPPFPELPFAADDLHSFWCVSRVPCNWLQGVEGTIDSAHVGVLHHTWLSKSAEVEGYGNITLALNQPPTYETEVAPYGMRAAALRTTDDGETYVPRDRVLHAARHRGTGRPRSAARRLDVRLRAGGRHRSPSLLRVLRGHAGAAAAGARRRGARPRARPVRLRRCARRPLRPLGSGP